MKKRLLWTESFRSFIRTDSQSEEHNWEEGDKLENANVRFDKTVSYKRSHGKCGGHREVFEWWLKWISESVSEPVHCTDLSKGADLLNDSDSIGTLAGHAASNTNFIRHETPVTFSTNNNMVFTDVM